MKIKAQHRTFCTLYYMWTARLDAGQGSSFTAVLWGASKLPFKLLTIHSTALYSQGIHDFNPERFHRCTLPCILSFSSTFSESCSSMKLLYPTTPLIGFLLSSCCSSVPFVLRLADGTVLPHCLQHFFLNCYALVNLIIRKWMDALWHSYRRVYC